MMSVTGIESVSHALSAAMPQTAGATAATADTGDGSFAASLTGAVDDLRELQSTADTLKVQAVTGDLDDIHSAMIASTRAAVTLELVAAVRNKGVNAFNEIMRMQA
jgi:flagellar hook-basal body complex protein FliE